MRPCWQRSIPPINWSSVLLPDPEGPNKQVTVPLGMVRSIPSAARTTSDPARYSWVTPASSIMLATTLATVHYHGAGPPDTVQGYAVQMIGASGACREPQHAAPSPLHSGSGLGADECLRL